jgi:hypothetical protein
MVKLLRRIINLFKKCKMAKINNTAAYAISNTIDGSDIVIGSENGNGGDTKNFQMSDISTFVLGNAVTPTLDDVCQQGNTTTTSIQINNVGGLSILTGPLTSNGSTFLLGSSTVINGTVNINNTADIADTLTLSKSTGVGLQVDADAYIDGNLTVTLGSALYTDEIRTTGLSSNLAFYTGGLQRGAFTSLGVLALTGGLQVLVGGALMNQGLTVNNLAQFNDDVLLGGSVPSSSTDTGLAGQIAVDATYIYVCVGANSWGRVAIDTTPF